MPAVIEKEMEQAVQRPPVSLPSASLIGTAFIVLSLVGLQYALPMAWSQFISPALGLAQLIDRLALVGLVGLGLAAVVYLYPRVVPGVPGARAGVVAGVLFCLVGFVVIYLGCRVIDLIFVALTNRGWVSKDFYDTRYLAGIPIAIVLAFLWLRWGWSLLNQNQVQRFLEKIEEQGWFATGSYKPNQGRLVRRLTFLGIVIVVVSGIYHFWPAIMRGMTGNWTWPMPFVDTHNLVLATMPGLVITTLVALVGLWFAWRAVNAPAAADFLISTSAEMQKVSWATRPQIVRDTIVVLVVTALLSAFLLFMDLFWVVLLRFFGVLKH